MSCCSGCAQGMGCDDHWLALAHRAHAQGLRGIGDPIHVGAWFRLGVEINGWGTWDDLFVDVDQIRQALDASGYVVPGVQVWKQAGLINAFIVVEGKSGREYGQALHLRDAVLSVISGLHPINAGSVQFEASTYDAGSGAETSTYVTAPRNVPSAPITQPIASALGVDTQTATYLAIGAAVVLGIVILRR